MRILTVLFLSLSFFMANGLKAGDCCFEEVTLDSVVMDCHDSDHTDSSSGEHQEDKSHSKESCQDQCCKITAKLPLELIKNQVALLVGHETHYELDLTAPKNVTYELLRPPTTLS